MKSYDYLQRNISEIMRSLVSKVSNNLSGESSLNIQKVNFKNGTYKEIVKQLKLDDESELSKLDKYHLVWLVGNDKYQIKHDSPYPEVSLNLIIMTLSDINRTSSQRLAINYNPILYPIYTELMEVIVDSPFFQGPYDVYPSHGWIENFNLGDTSDNGSASLKLPDVCDGIIVTDLKLRLNRERIAAAYRGPSKNLVYINNVSQLACNLSENQLLVTLNGYQYAGGGHPSYGICFDVNNVEVLPITLGGSVGIPSIPSDGEYVGYIQCDDGYTVSKLQFYYSVKSGLITKYTTSILFSLGNFNASGLIYPNVEFEIETEIISNKSNILQREYTEGGGNVMYSEPFTPATSGTTDMITTHKLLVTDTYKEVGFNLTIDGAGNTSTLLESFSYYKIS